jgi:hypothetical protein
MGLRQHYPPQLPIKEPEDMEKHHKSGVSLVMVLYSSSCVFPWATFTLRSWDARMPLLLDERGITGEKQLVLGLNRFKIEERRS